MTQKEVALQCMKALVQLQLRHSVAALQECLNGTK